MNITYEKLKEDLTQSKYVLKKDGLYHGPIKEKIEGLLKLLRKEDEKFEETLNDLYDDLKHNRIG